MPGKAKRPPELMRGSHAAFELKKSPFIEN
jgi:hypothetical protein